jgi:cyclic pyranopterin phosphate synthase
MIDPFQRKITYLRLSVTDRCDLRCDYCMAEKMTFLPKSEVLTLEELERLSLAFISLGIKKIRITGGEPLVRSGLMGFLKKLGRHINETSLHELTLTTNGTRLSDVAADLKDAGLKRINVSLDSLNPDTFKKVTRFGDITKVLRGIEEARKVGLAVRINTVLLKNINDTEIDNLIHWCGERHCDLALIETMPLGNVETDRMDRYLSITEMMERLKKTWTFTPLSITSGGPARYYNISETGQKLGLITPLSHGFCESCNRIRVTCQGILYLCLGQNDAVDLRKVLRESSRNEDLHNAIRNAIAHKPKGHDFKIERHHEKPALDRHMSVTGG